MPHPAIDGLEGYALAFEDDFDDLGDINVYGNSPWYTDADPANVYVEDSVLHLVSRRADDYPNIGISTQSAGIAFQYGYFEARMKWTAGNGAWPGFWLLSQRHIDNPDWPEINSYCALNGLDATLCYSAELDIFEGQGDDPSGFYGTSHRNSAAIYGEGNTQSSPNYTNVAPIDLTTGFHRYGMLWERDRISWYLDDVFLHETTPFDSTPQPMIVLLQMWIGGWSVGTDLTTPDELHTEVDWVRIYQQPSLEAMTPGTLSATAAPSGALVASPASSGVLGLTPMGEG